MISEKEDFQRGRLEANVGERDKEKRVMVSSYLEVSLNRLLKNKDRKWKKKKQRIKRRKAKEQNDGLWN